MVFHQQASNSVDASSDVFLPCMLLEYGLLYTGIFVVFAMPGVIQFLLQMGKCISDSLSIWNLVVSSSACRYRSSSFLLTVTFRNASWSQVLAGETQEEVDLADLSRKFL